MRLDSPDIIGTLTISTVSNAVGDFLTYSGTTVTRRTPAQVLTDIGAQAVLTNPVTGTGVSGQVTFWNGTNSIIGDTGFIWDNTNKRLSVANEYRLNNHSFTRVAILGSSGTWGGGYNFLLSGSTVTHDSTGTISGIVYNINSLDFYTSTSQTAGTSAQYRWAILSSGVFQSNGAQTIQTTTGNLTIATGGGNGNVIVTPNGTGFLDSQLRTLLRGNVTIGITTLTDRARLHVLSASQLAPTLGNTSTGISLIASNNDSAYGTVFFTKGNGQGSIQQMRVDGTATSYSLTLQELGGNVLIGTTTDGGQRLQVSGTTLITGTLEVDTINNGTGDFVTLTAGGILTRRTATETRGDIGAASTNDNITGVTLTTTTLTLNRGSGNLTASVPTFNQNTTGTAAGLSATLVVGSGGTGATTLTGVVIGNGASAMTAVAGTASQLLRRNAGNTAYEFFTIAGSDITGAALTATNDTNVTLTLGGTSATALLRAASLTLGWTGTLAVARGGTGLSALGTANQLLRVNAGATALEYFTPSFISAAITSLNGLTGATQTFTNDTNVTITSATTIHTIGWSGQLAVSRGGTGASTLTGVLIGNGTSAVTAVAGTASQLLRRNAGNTAYEFFTQTLGTISDVVITTPSTNQVLQFNGTNWVNATISTGGITGSGTINYVPKFTASTAIGNSLIFDNGTQVLVNTTTATGETFEVNGTARIAGSYLALNSTGNDGGKLRLFGSSSEYAIGTITGVTFGAINNNTVVNFLMPNTTAMGWRWSDSGHTAAQGAMALSTDGRVTIAHSLRIGYGETDTTIPGSSDRLDISGNASVLGSFFASSNIITGGQFASTTNPKGNSGTGTVTFNWDEGNVQTVTLTGNCTFAFSNPQSGASYQIIITQDTTGGRTITWPTIHWEGKTVPTLTGTLSSKDIVTLTYDGTNYNGVISKNHGV